MKAEFEFTKEVAQKIAVDALHKAGYENLLIVACDHEEHFVAVPEKLGDGLHLLEAAQANVIAPALADVLEELREEAKRNEL